PIPNGSQIHIYGDGTGTVRVGRNSGIPSCGPSYVHLHNNLNINPVGVVTTTWNDPNIVVRGNFGSNVRIDAMAAIVDSSRCVDPSVIAVDDNASTYTNLNISINVLSNDTNNLDSIYTSSTNTFASGATANINPNFTIDYYPPPNFTGVDSFEYIACNELGFCDTAMVYVTVGAAGCPPGLTPTFALDSSYATTVISCRTNDNEDLSDCDPEILGIPDDAIINNDFKKSDDSITIQLPVMVQSVISDPVVKFFVQDGEWDNTAGVGFGLYVSTDNVNYTFIQNVFRPASTTSVTYGSTFDVYLSSITLSQNFQYIRMKHIGTDNKKINFDAIEVVHSAITACVNDTAPIAIDDSASTSPNLLVNIDVLANDYDIWGDTLVIDTIITSPTQGGTAVINPSGTIDFTPALNFTGVDTFEYIVCDTHSVTLCDTAQVIVSIVNNPLIAVDDIDSTEENISVIIDVLANDTDPDGDVLNITQIISQSNLGEQVLINPDSTILYIPPFGFLGLDSFAYEVCDPHTPTLCDTAWVYITVNPFVNDPPIAVNDTITTEQDVPVSFDVLLNDIEPELQNLIFNSIITNPTNGTLINYGDGNITYTPNPAYNGPDIFTYSVCDDYSPALCDTATVVITVSPPNNNPPVANDDNANAFDGFATVVNVLSNDFDSDGNLVVGSVSVIYPPSHGIFVNNLDSTISYTPTPGYTGPDSLIYVVCDDGTPLPSECDTATLYFTVFAVNQPPLAVNDYDTTSVN
ncbi:MAG: tandem-95 repeat protein, partial [Bacteroidia bacterium]|nr:tandem-95 repeat protein [Bacteroidia bacterium]